MARKFDMIKDIDGTRETLKIGARITHLWCFKDRAKTSHLEMVIMDAKGDKIQVMVKKDELVTWKGKLKEQSTYVMHNFKVVLNHGQYKVCDHPYKLIFTGGTTLKEQELTEVPPNVYVFKNFGEILRGDYRRDMLVDVIGTLHDITHQHLVGYPKKVVFTLKNLSGDFLYCTLWGDYALKLMSYYKERNDTGPIILILTQARIKAASGYDPASISNTWYGSKLLINEDVKEIQMFKNSFAGTNFRELSSQDVRLSQLSASSRLSGSSQFSEQDRFMYKAKVVHLSEIKKVKEETICVTVGTIGKFIVDKNGWSYDACSKCGKKTEIKNEPFKCKCGKYNEKAVPRYKLEINVYDKNDDANFIFWDRECFQLIGKSALELRKLMKECGEEDPKLYPKPLDRMLGCTLAFRVKGNFGFSSLSVTRVSDDKDLIKSIMERFGADEVATEADKPMSNENQVSQHYTQSLSATTYYDPDLVIELTPTKRLSSEVQYDFFSEDIGSSQLSSTKKSKYIEF